MLDAPKEPGLWLLKTEPDVFSLRDLRASPQQTTFWDGVRNYQARNLIRDAKSSTASPRWYGIAVTFVQAFARPVTLAQMRHVAALEDMALLQKGSRLSVQPVGRTHWDIIVRRGGRSKGLARRSGGFMRLGVALLQGPY